MRSVTGQTPKVLVEIQGRPFITYLLRQLVLAGFSKAVISIGYGADMVMETLGAEFDGMSLEYCREESPLGTGGAVRYALEHVIEGPIVAMNGDSIVNTSLAPFVDMAIAQPMRSALLAVRVQDISRYGSLQIRDGIVEGFCEKGRAGSGWINAGIYYFPRQVLENLAVGVSASLENDVLGKQEGLLRAFCCDCEFIDIGTPQSYSQGQSLKWLVK